MKLNSASGRVRRPWLDVSTAAWRYGLTRPGPSAALVCCLQTPAWRSNYNTIVLVTRHVAVADPQQRTAFGCIVTRGICQGTWEDVFRVSLVLFVCAPGPKHIKVRSNPGLVICKVKHAKCDTLCLLVTVLRLIGDIVRGHSAHEGMIHECLSISVLRGNVSPRVDLYNFDFDFKGQSVRSAALSMRWALVFLSSALSRPSIFTRFQRPAWRWVAWFQAESNLS